MTGPLASELPPCPSKKKVLLHDFADGSRLLGPPPVPEGVVRILVRQKVQEMHLALCDSFIFSGPYLSSSPQMERAPIPMELESAGALDPAVGNLPP